MAKVAKIAAAVVGVVAIVASGGLGAPLAGAVTGFLGVGAGTLTAIGAGLSIAGALLSKPPTVPSSQSERLTLSIDPQALRKSALGETALPTDVRYQEWFGTNQERCGLIVAHAGHRIQSVDAIWLNDELAWTATGGTQGRFINYFWVRQVVTEGSPSIIANVAPGSRWNALCRLTGCAYSHLEFKVTGNSSKAESPFSSGIPQRITVIGKGSPVYDPRRDSTVPGGSGPMRATDQSTWRYIADDGTVIGGNVALQILREKLGWRITNPATGEKKLSVGLGLPVKRIDLESYIIAANLCDEAVTAAAGSTERRYVGAATLSEGDDPTTRLNMLCAACCGRITERSGKLGLAIAHNDLAAIAADDGLNDDDLVGPFVWQPDPAITDVPNVVRGRYTDPSPNSLYQLLPYPDVGIASVDGIDRTLLLDLSAVQSPAQAQRVAAQALMRRQYDRTFQATFDIRAWKYRVGDPLPFTLAALGFVRKPFRVVDQQYAAGGKCAMTLRIEDPAIYPIGGADRPAVQAAAPNVYNTSNNPIILAVQDAQQAADGASARANAAIAAVAGLGDDGMLSRDEKARILIPKNGELTNERGLLDAQAALSPNVPAVVNARATAAQAWAAWLAYRDSLSPAWDNVALDTFVTRATFTGVLTDLRFALDLLSQALQSSIGGVPAQDIADAVKDANGNVVPARDQFAAVKAQLDADVTSAQVDASHARDDAAAARADLAIEVQRAKNAEGAINTTLAAVKSTADGASAGVTDEATVRARDDIALGNRISTTEAQLAGAQASVLSARIGDEAVARANGDNAIASRTAVTEAQLAGTQDSALKARILNEETTRAGQDAALANRATSLEAGAGTSAAGTAFNPNFARWPDDSSLPAQWDYWQLNGGRIARSSGGSVRGSLFCADFRNDTPNVDWGLLQRVWMTPGAWVIEATISLDQASLSGAGVTLSGAQGIDFVAEADTSGAVGDLSGVRSFSKMINWTSSGSVNLHAMGGWGGFGRTIAAKYMRWFYLNVRPATDGEIRAGKALTDAGSALARITAEETTRANQDAVLSNRLSTTEAQLAGSQGSQLQARIAAEETARADQGAAIANRTSTVEAQLSGAQPSQLGSRITTTESAIVGLNGRAAAYWHVLAVAGNNRAQMTVRADANGGAGVDIVGDVRIVGSDGDGSTEISGRGVFVFYPNGQPNVKLGRW